MLHCMVGMRGEPPAVPRMALLAMLGTILLAPGVAEAASSAQCPTAATGQISSPGGNAVIATRRAASGVIGAPASAPTAASPDGFKQKLDRIGWKYDVLENGNYRVVFNVGETKRTQLFYISGGTQSYDCLVIREFFAPAAKVSASVNGAKALELMAESHTKKMGSWEIHGDTLMYTAKVSDAIDGEDLRSLMNMIVKVADEAELKLTGADAY